jgi:DEAD/DEAH box helicase domain-containing protein
MHQEAAWQRLCSNRLASATLVATGTGSEKMECFLYPLLDHCARAKGDGVPGVKALVIYPMNTLATDRRDDSPRLSPRLQLSRGCALGSLSEAVPAKMGGDIRT